ncbi:capsular polysaccharide biosynthesis protein [Jannaschia sp. CCS1]|uniref:capsular polysaccharide biosynthesis protein n=1 Tax=Jannaschia sp. (strain CCS1) TaxID=290400 RepID=UPI000053D89B|nr:capsular polysaccharide biosynthesis protein [Jannaschia sp. CCS1]ABD56337.1 Capsule polysaccharide biosynthesis [Jannaschia sp. CCS1]
MALAGDSGTEPSEAPSAPRRRAYHYNAGFLTNTRVRRILALAGYDLKLGTPDAADDVIVWGHSPYAPRGEAVADSTGAHLVRVEDAFLRSLRPGRSGEPPLGLVIDRRGMYFDATRASDLEHILATHPFDDTALLNRARDVMARMAEGHLSKYAATDPALDPPAPGYVLLIDQTKGDASIQLGQATPDSFAEALTWAREDHPDAHIVVKTHPETRDGHRPGHFDPDGLPPNVSLDDRPISLWRMFEGARAVYTVTSQAGFEAILAGHKPVTFGVPFYAGWGLTDDRRPVPVRRQRVLTRAQLVAGALLLYPTWYDPYRDGLGEVEDTLGALEAQARSWREDRAGYTAIGMSRWKRGHLRAGFGQHGPLDFADQPVAGRPTLVWAGKETSELQAACGDAHLLRMEDGFLRSRGLGADLVPPLSLVLDDLGIYYDPTRESRLERLIAEAAALPPARLDRAERLIQTLRRTGLTKYNLPGGALPDIPPDRPLVLIPGQVEDDASIRLGAGAITTNAALLAEARRLHPGAYLIYKPHPDVEAGLRIGVLPEEARHLADHIAETTGAEALLALSPHVITMTSAMGFEALIRGLPVTTLGAPFYAGWGLTTDLGDVPPRRTARPSLAALVHAALITYPRYMDPRTGLPCPVEIAVERLSSGEGMPSKPILRIVAKLQIWLSGQSRLWRR